MIRTLSVFALASLLALAWAGPAPAQEKVRHPHLSAALYELSQARKELADAGGGFGGHRKKALEAMDVPSRRGQARHDFDTISSAVPKDVLGSGSAPR